MSIGLNLDGFDSSPFRCIDVHFDCQSDKSSHSSVHDSASVCSHILVRPYPVRTIESTPASKFVFLRKKTESCYRSRIRSFEIVGLMVFDCMSRTMSSWLWQANVLLLKMEFCMMVTPLSRANLSNANHRCHSSSYVDAINA